MAQHDFNIANQTFPATRTDLNNALEALATLSSGSTAPTTTYANMLWYDTGDNILKMRSETDDAWINVGYLCQSTNKFCVLDDTNVVNTSGTQTGRLGDQPTSAWEAGTSTTESLVSPAKVKAAVEAASAGYDQTYQDVSASRVAGTSYQNTTDKPIFVMVSTRVTDIAAIEVSNDGTTWFPIVRQTADRNHPDSNQFVVPVGAYYRVQGTILHWVELR